jgi:hypothetical protein
VLRTKSLIVGIYLFVGGDYLTTIKWGVKIKKPAIEQVLVGEESIFMRALALFWSF